MRLTIAQIASHNMHTGGHYFDCDTLRFFGQTRRSFSIYVYKGRTFVLDPSGGTWPRKLWSVAEYDPTTGDMDSPRHIVTDGLETRAEVRAAIRAAIDTQGVE